MNEDNKVVVTGGKQIVLIKCVFNKKCLIMTHKTFS